MQQGGNTVAPVKIKTPTCGHSVLISKLIDDKVFGSDSANMDPDSSEQASSRSEANAQQCAVLCGAACIYNPRVTTQMCGEIIANECHICDEIHATITDSALKME